MFSNTCETVLWKRDAERGEWGIPKSGPPWVSEESIHSTKFSLNPAGDGRNSIHMSVAVCVWDVSGSLQG